MPKEPRPLDSLETDKAAEEASKAAQAAKQTKEIDEVLQWTGAEPVPEGEEKGPEGEVEAEPEVKVSLEEEPPAVASDEDRLSQALSTIEAQKLRLDELESRVVTPKAEREPVIEYEEVLPGVRLPKDPSLRPVRLTEADLLKIGWNTDVVGAINTLGNMFYNLIMQTMPVVVRQDLKQEFEASDAEGKRKGRFFELYPDLKGNDDLLEIVERRVRQDPSNKGLRGDAYTNKVGEEAQKRVAQMRNLSLAQYRAGVKTTPRETQPKPTSRAVSTSAASRPSGRSAQPASEQQKHMDDLIDHK